MRNTSILSNHNQRKLSILLSVFNKYKTAWEVAAETLPSGADPIQHRRLVQIATSRLRRGYDHPYLTHENLTTMKRGGIVAYKCTQKGKRVACELSHRKKKDLSLNWKRSPRHRHGKKRTKYHIDCRGNCKKCQYYPIPKTPTQTRSPWILV